MNKKALNLPILISMVVGNMIGSGIYLLPASLAEYGTISLLSWIYTSIGAMLLALTFCSLNKRFPETGGAYAYCREAWGKPIGFAVAYIYWISNLVCVAALAVSSIGYLGFISPAFNAGSASYNPQLVLGFELATVWLFTIVNLLGVHTAGLVQLFITIIKIIPLLVIVALGLGHIHFGNLTQFTSGDTSNFAAISSASALTFWAFIGLESATVPAENTKGPRDIFKATIYGTLITCLIYLISTFVLMGMIPINELKQSQFPFATAATMLFGNYAAFVIAICAVISGIGALNVCVMLQGQIVFAAARDNLFPKVFVKLTKRDVPYAAQIFSSCLVTILLITTMQPSLLDQFNNIALLAALLTLVTYFASTLAEIKFQMNENKKISQILISKPTIIAILAALYALWMISSVNLKILFVGTLIILACLPFYYLFVRKQALSTNAIYLKEDA